MGQKNSLGGKIPLGVGPAERKSITLRVKPEGQDQERTFWGQSWLGGYSLTPGAGSAHLTKALSRKQRFRRRPAQSWTPTMPKMKKTKKQSRRTFPSMGSVSSSRVTRIRMPEGCRAGAQHSEALAEGPGAVSPQARPNRSQILIKAICVQRPGTGKADESGCSPRQPGQTCPCSTSSRSTSRALVDQSEGQGNFCGDPGTLGSAAGRASSISSLSGDLHQGPAMGKAWAGTAWQSNFEVLFPGSAPSGHQKNTAQNLHGASGGCQQMTGPHNKTEAGRTRVLRIVEGNSHGLGALRSQGSPS